MHVIKTYSIEEVAEAIESRKSNRIVMPDGSRWRYSDRIRLFFTKTFYCVNEGCEREGTIFHLETHQIGVTPHLNFYAVDEDGTHVLMTKDHIYPKSKGGPNTLDNYQTMCSPCNSKKSDKV